jgi:alpha-tubulin suppressor-like RCC1 family protein
MRGRRPLPIPRRPLTPTSTPGDTPALVAVGVFHACAADGGVRCWGANERGQLGQGSTASFDDVVTVRDLSGVMGLGAGDQHTCALVALPGTVWCWGLNDYGQLGVGDDVDRSLPTRVAGVDDVTQLVLGDFHTCAIRTDRSLWCWGMNSSGQLGTPPSDTPVVRPQRVEGVLDVASVDAGFQHTCVVTVDGAVRCAGDDLLGQSGGASPGSFGVVQGIDDAVEVRIGMYQSCARRRGGGVACWGSNEDGQFGQATIGDLSRTAQSVEVLGTASAIAVGMDHVCSVVDGIAGCAGPQEIPFGLEDEAPADEGRETMPHPLPAVAIDGSNTQVCVVQDDRSVGCWDYKRGSEFRQRT